MLSVKYLALFILLCLAGFFIDSRNKGATKGRLKWSMVMFIGAAVALLLFLCTLMAGAFED